MKNFIIYILIIGISYSQATGLSIYGLGEKIDKTDPASISLGNSSFFSGNSKQISNNAPSTFWRSALTRFTIHSGYNFLNIPQHPGQHQQNLTSFSILFPVGNKKVFGLGLNPLYRINNTAVNDSEFQFVSNSGGNPIAHKNTYYIEGGLSEVFMAYSQKLTSHFSAGINYSIMFGNQILNDQLFTYDILINSSYSGGLLISEFIDNSDTLYAIAMNGMMTEVNKFHKFSGSSISGEGRYSKNGHELVLNVLIKGSPQIETTNKITVGNSTSVNSFHHSNKKFSSEFGVGYQYKFSNISGIAFELHNESPFKIPENVAIFNIMPPKETSIHLGSYYQIRNSRIGFWNNFNLKCGAYMKNLGFSDGDLKDIGVTLGLGLEYLGNTQSVDLAFRVGKKESKVFIDKNEEYFSFHIGITTGEKWFMKRRRK